MLRLECAELLKKRFLFLLRRGEWRLLAVFYLL